MTLELIYFKACPFAQRTLIALETLGITFQKTLINPMDKPAWMADLTPMGQIPLLRVDGETVLFDSSAICEYLNDSHQGGLLPEDPLQRGRHRMMIEFAGECQKDFAGLISAAHEEAFNQARDALLKKLTWLEKQVSEKDPLFAGKNLSLMDIAYAPLFLRMKHLQEIVPFYTPSDLPRLQRWGENLLAEEAVKASIEGKFSMIFTMVIKSRGKGGFVEGKLAR